MNKIGLVLEGGAMRGLFSAGIMDVMMENHLFPAGIAGVSAGAAFGCNFKSQQIGRALRYNKRFCQDKRQRCRNSRRIRLLICYRSHRIRRWVRLRALCWRWALPNRYLLCKFLHLRQVESRIRSCKGTVQIRGRICKLQQLIERRLKLWKTTKVSHSLN